MMIETLAKPFSVPVGLRFVLGIGRRRTRPSEHNLRRFQDLQSTTATLRSRRRRRRRRGERELRVGTRQTSNALSLNSSKP